MNTFCKNVLKTVPALLLILAVIAVSVSCGRLSSVLEPSYEPLPTIEPSEGSAAAAQSGAGTQEVSEVSSPAVSEPSEADESRQEVSLTFASKKLLQDHYTKHGIEMGFDSPEAYLAAANRVVNNPAALHKLEAEDGDDVYYVEETNEFVVVSTKGYIRTYFLPSGGKAYFDRQ